MIGIPLICVIYMIIKCHTNNTNNESHIPTPEPIYTPTLEHTSFTNEYELTLCNGAWVDVNKKMV